MTTKRANAPIGLQSERICIANEISLHIAVRIDAREQPNRITLRIPACAGRSSPDIGVGVNPPFDQVNSSLARFLRPPWAALGRFFASCASNG